MVKVNKRTLRKLVQDPEASAKAVRLRYVSDNEEGIRRIRSGRGFRYQYRNKAVRDKNQMERIRALVLPPAWEKVWICKDPNGHLQATGLDAMGRKQYRYHPRWVELRSQTKFYNLLELGKALPLIRKQVNKDLARPGLPQEKVLAAVVYLMDKTGIRTGNEIYEKMYGSIGVTTLKDKHTDVKGDRVRFSFRGKKGVEHTISLKSRKLASIIRQCRDIPGKELFQYIDEEGKRQAIESGMVNDYIRSHTGAEFTAKDLRTWNGTVAALLEFRNAGPVGTDKKVTQQIVEVLDKVAERLGNTRAVCKKYYVHPCLSELYEKGNLEKWCKRIRSDKTSNEELLPEEKILLKILEKN